MNTSRIWNGISSAALAFAVAFGVQARSAQALEWTSQELMAISTAGSTLNVINWKVGDTLSYNVSMGFFGKVGTTVKTVRSDEGTALWLRATMALQGQNEVIDTLINKADGKVLKMLRNGKEQEIPNDPIEIVSQEAARITVPAGTFESIHIVAKNKQFDKIDLWLNPRDTAMEGTLKQQVPTQFGVMTLELTSFVRN